MPRGDKPTTVALALKDGWVYEDALPAMSKEEYDWWYRESLVLDGVRMGPPFPTPTQPETLKTGFICECCQRQMELRIDGKFCNECYHSRAAIAGPRGDAWREAASIVEACLNVHSTYSDAEREFASHLIEVFKTRDQHPDYKHRNSVRAYPAATSSPAPADWFDLALRYMRGDPALTDVPYSDDSVLADFLRFWDALTPHARSVVKAVFTASTNFEVKPAPPERTQVAGEQSYSEGFDDAARVSRVLNNVAATDSARRAAEEISSTFGLRFQEDSLQRTAAIISKHLAAAPADDDAEARRLLTECCYTIQQLAEQQAMPDNFYERTLQAVGKFLEPRTTTKGDR